MRAWLVVVVACASPGSAPSFPAIAGAQTASDGSTTIAVTALAPGDADYAMTFPTTGVRLPSSLMFGSDQILAGSSDPCGQIEAGLGLGVTQVVRASADDFMGANGSGGDVSITMSGPAVAQVRVAWDAPYTCNAAHHLHGTTTFTAFPGGRIVRHDEGVVPSDEGLLGTDQCMCGAPATMTFESFYQLAPGSDVDATGAAIAGTGATQGCTVYADHAVAVAWPDTDTLMRAQSTWTHYWSQDAAQLSSAPQDLTSAIRMSDATTCSDVLAGLADPSLTIGGQSISSDSNGIYTDTNAHGSGFDIAPDGQPIPASFAVIVDIGDHAEITRSPSTGDDFFTVQQLAGDTALLLWFRDGLGLGETIHIEPK